MRKAILAPLLLLAPVATAADYESEPQSVVFEGGNTVLTQQYQLPLILNVGFILESARRDQSDDHDLQAFAGTAVGLAARSSTDGDRRARQRP